jgi:23S rRNA (cytidine1920-2'-O)/16S rRNA (cytidine1409-2'-O)-methyltransferase
MKNSLEKNHQKDTGAKRLDMYLVEKEIVPSRQKAQKIIDEGFVLVDGVVSRKHNKKIKPEHNVEIKDFSLYVGRGGEKLEYALKEFSTNASQKNCMDVGSSTGGFTEVLLKSGALKVYAFDTGSEQFNQGLLQNNKDKIILSESTDIRNVDVLPDKIDLCVIDVSFISIKSVLPDVFRLMKDGGEVIALIKPQFEVGSSKIKKGIVTDPIDAKNAVTDIENFVTESGCKVIRSIEAKPKGKKGNQEYFIHLSCTSK